MKELKPVLLVMLIILLGGTAVRLVIVQHRNEKAARQQAARAAELDRLANHPPRPTPAAPVWPTEPSPEKIPVVPANVPPPAKTNSPVLAEPQAVVPPPSPREVRQDPLARAALFYVGADPYAEAYWMDAIFDPSLSDQEREDLMEDLNEEGLSNPRRPAPEDYPLILNRIRIIEDVAPQADPFMLEHLAEAYKDLINLLAGQPPG